MTNQETQEVLPKTKKSDLPYDTVRANQLEEGDILVDSDGSYDDTVYDVFTDEYGTWLEFDNDIGYTNPYRLFMIEPRTYNE